MGTYLYSAHMDKYAELIDLGQRLKKSRLEKGYSQEHLASLIGISSRYYGYIERGEKNLTYRNLIKILIALDVEFSEILPPLKIIKKIVLTKKQTIKK